MAINTNFNADFKLGELGQKIVVNYLNDSGVKYW